VPSYPLVSAGTAVPFTFTAGGVADVTAYEYGLDSNPPDTTINAASLGGNATTSVTPTTDGVHNLYVRTIDRAGNQSPITTYTLNIGAGGITSPPHR
jgi:outer membrane autotransporter protein